MCVCCIPTLPQKLAWPILSWMDDTSENRIFVEKLPPYLLLFGNLWSGDLEEVNPHDLYFLDVHRLQNISLTAFLETKRSQQKSADGMVKRSQYVTHPSTALAALLRQPCQFLFHCGEPWELRIPGFSGICAASVSYLEKRQ